MHIPTNGIHWYLGLPLMLFIAVRGIYLYKKNKSTLDLYFGMVGVFFSLCFIAYGFPPLISDNSTLLTYSTILADILQFVALFFMWLAVVRLILPKNKALGFVVIAIDLLFIGLGTYFSITENLAYPVTLAQSTTGSWSLIYQFSFGYQAATALQYLSFILVAIAFLSRIGSVKSNSQKVRLASISAVLFLVGGIYVVQPFLAQPTVVIPRAMFIAFSLVVASLFIILAPLAFSKKPRR